MNRNSSTLVLRIALGPQEPGAARQIVLDLQLRGDPTEWSVGNLDVLSTSAVALPEIAASGTIDIRMQTHALSSWRMTREELGLPGQWQDVGKLKDQSRPWLKLVLTGIDALISKVLPEYRVGWVSSFSAPIRLPIAVQRTMKALLVHWQVTNQPLWLEFATGAEYLPLLPWERMLQEVMQQPVLRLPYQGLPTIPRPTSVQVVVCVSTAGDDRLTAKALQSLIAAIASTLPGKSKVDVFADTVAYALIADLPSTSGVSTVVHRPEAGSEAENTTEGAQGSSVTRPWTDWIRSALQGRAVDVLHVVAHGIPTPGSPSIALRFAPAGNASGNSPLRLISTQALHDLAVELGAWCILCTSPGGSLSRLALRLLIDELSKRHLYVAALHDLATDEQSSALGLTYKFLFGGSDSPPPNSEAMTIYCHPAVAGRISTIAEPPVLNALREVADQTSAVQATGDPVPSWMAASQRYLEETSSKAASVALQSESDKAVADGITDAVRVISRLMQPK